MYLHATIPNNHVSHEKKKIFKWLIRTKGFTVTSKRGNGSPFGRTDKKRPTLFRFIKYGKLKNAIKNVC